MQAHTTQLDAEYLRIVERRDIWPLGPSTGPVQGRKPLSAGAREPSDVKGRARPLTAPLRASSARRREVAVRKGRAKAPTGFSFAMRIAFEHMDKDREGALSEGDVIQGLKLLGFDSSQLSLSAIFKGFGKDINQRIEFDEFESMLPLRGDLQRETFNRSWGCWAG
ncbi:hypothetical protein T484DRAFT_3613824 [Baffinella frigidus]|nr:hypothetical protein T484DRAFT_3613824 [Cryptophyta sp. CCMP2293]